MVAGTVSDYDADQGKTFKKLLLRHIDTDGEVVWQKIIGEWSGVNYLSFVELTGDGGFLIGGRIRDDSNMLDDVYVMKLDRHGNSQWRTLLGKQRSDAVQTNRLNGVETRDGEYVVSWGEMYGADTYSWDYYIVRLDNQGMAKLTQSLKDGSVYDMVPAADNGVIALMTTMDGSNVLLKMNAAGAVVWQKTITLGADYLMQQTPEGGCILVSSALNGPGGVLRFIQVDDAGALVTETLGGPWVSSFSSTSYEETTDGGGVIICTFVEAETYNERIGAIKVDSGGTIVWQKIFGTNWNDYQIHNFSATEDGGCIMVGRPRDSASVSWDWLAVQLNAQGDVQWQKTINYGSAGPAGYYFSALMTRAGDAGYYLFVNDHQGSAGNVVMKLSADFEIPGCDVISVGTGSILVTDALSETPPPLAGLRDSTLDLIGDADIAVGSYSNGAVADHYAAVEDMCADNREPVVKNAVSFTCGLSFMVESPSGVDVEATQQHVTLENSSGEIVTKALTIREYDEGKTIQVSFEELSADTYKVTVTPYADDGTAGDTVTQTVTVECNGSSNSGPNSGSSGEQKVPVLAVPENLYADSSSSQLSFDIQNAGEGVLEWNIKGIEYFDGQPAWIVVQAPVSGETRTSHTVTISINAEELSAGTHTARITIVSNGGKQVLLVTLTVAETLGAQFSGCSSNDGVPSRVQFLDESAGDVVAWEWTFGDGGVSYEQNPFYTYYGPGMYTVSLLVTDANGDTDMLSKNECIRVGDCSVDAEFIGNPKTGKAPQTVRFTDQSEGPVSIYVWDFGDGGTSEQQHPEHTYHTPGVYTVTLTVKGAGCSSTETKTNLLLVASSQPGSTPVCPLRASLQGISGSQKHADTLRDFRDHLLSTTLTGKLLTGLYYASAGDVNAVIGQDDELKTDIGDLVTGLAPRVRAVVDGQSTAITQAELSRIKGVLHRLSDNGGAVMRMTVNFVLDKIDNEVFLQQYGIMLIGD
ncbi:MAG: PKD domain-containing protein [Deltaproteobacteria bacterium]|nr:PKD domain-containing protein [Deltaproteobacteria bacterium]